MEMLRFKFHHNRKINEEFDFWVVEGGGEEGVLRFQKFGKAAYRLMVPLPHGKFQHSRSTIKCLKIGGTDLAFGGERGIRFP